MFATQTNAADGRTVGPDAGTDKTPHSPKLRAHAAVDESALRNIGRRLVDGPTAAAKAGCSYRHWLRLADAGKAPPGIKLGALRRWDLDELDRWIADGCPNVRRAGGAR